MVAEFLNFNVYFDLAPPDCDRADVEKYLEARKAVEEDFNLNKQLHTWDSIKKAILYHGAPKLFER